MTKITCNDSLQMLHNNIITISYKSVSIDIYLLILDIMTKLDNDHLFINNSITNSIKNEMMALND